MYICGNSHPDLCIQIYIILVFYWDWNYVFSYFWKKQKHSEHGKSSREKRKLDNIQLRSNTLWVTSLVETMDIQRIRQVYMYFQKSHITVLVQIL